MKPQVNLHPQISQEETGITLNHILMMLIAGVVIAILGTFGQGFWVWQKKQTLAQWQIQLNQVRGRLVETERMFPTAVKAQDLELEVNDLQAAVVEKQQLLNLLDSGTELQTKGFYNFLSALSNNHRKGLWLTEIDIKPGFRQVGLYGITLSSETLPQYIQDLEGTSFSGIEFGRLTMKQVAPDYSAYEFELKSQLTAGEATP